MVFDGLFRFLDGECDEFGVSTGGAHDYAAPFFFQILSLVSILLLSLLNKHLKEKQA